jgi:E3 ubiquitin-protein ligase mind-bomb
LKSKSYLSSFDGIDIHGVNQTGDTALHLTLYGEKWNVAEKILKEFPDYDVNTINSLGDTPFHLAAKLQCEMVLTKKILVQTNSENVNKPDQHGQTALHIAIINESTTFVEEVLKRKDMDFNLKNNKNQTALHFATLWKNMQIDLFRIILEKTTDVNAQAQNGHTALHLAIVYKSTTAVKELVKRKDVDFNVKNSDNLTALHLSTLWKDIPNNLFRIILEKTSDINAQDKNGHTALHIKIWNKSETAVKELLKHKDVDINVKNNDNHTPLYLASGWNNIPIDLFKKILEKSADINAQDEEGLSALHWAIQCKSKTAVKELLKHKDVDVNVKDKDNFTPLHSATLWSNIPIDLFRTILEKSTNVNAQAQNGHTALRLALRKENETAVKELLKHKDVDVNLKNNKNQTALHFAAEWKDMPIDLFRIVLEKSADFNAQDEDGRTALHVAIHCESKTAVKELLKHMDVDVKDKDNFTPLYLASGWNNIPIDLFRIILEKTSNINAQDEEGLSALHWAILNKSETAVKELLKHKDVDVNVKDNDNNTALHFTVCYWKDIQINLFKQILEKTTNINANNILGRTALDWLIEEESITTAITELLKREDVDVNIRNIYNLTTLHWVTIRKDFPIDLFKKVLEKSADVNAQDDNECTALHLAIMHKSTSAIKELLKHKDVDVSLKNNNDQTALHLATMWEDMPVDLFTIIQGKSTDVDAQNEDRETALHRAIMCELETEITESPKQEELDVSDNQTAQHFVSVRKGNPIKLEKDGETALHIAITIESEIMVWELLSRDLMDVNAKNNKNQTAIHFAILWKNMPIELFRIILEKSDDVNGQDEDGHTALHWAMGEKFETAVEELLKGKDVDVNIKDNCDYSALDLLSAWEDIPDHLFNIFAGKATADAQAQNEAT